MSGGGSTNIPDSASQKALASIAAQRFNLYQKHYVPLENQFMQDVFAMSSPSSFDNIEGYVSSLQQPEFQNARRQLEAQAFQMGADPTSGQYQAASTAATTSQARGMGLGAAEGLSGQVDRYYQGMQNIVAMGQGQAGAAISGLADVGDIAQRTGAAQARTGMGNYLGRQQTIGSFVGTGLGIGMMGGSSSGKKGP
tara:strand:- start:1228 stop:1815 length:588 start_codon:yes stop_codon:yes gene_type:complete